MYSLGHLLDEYTAEGESSEMAIFKLYSGLEPAKNHDPAAVQAQTITAPPPEQVFPSNPPLPQQPYSQGNYSLLQYSDWNQGGTHASSQWNPTQPSAVPVWNTQLQHNRSSSLHPPDNPPLQEYGSSSLLPQLNPPNSSRSQTDSSTYWTEAALSQQLIYSDQPVNPNPLTQGNLSQENIQADWYGSALPRQLIYTVQPANPNPLAQGNLSCLQHENIQADLSTDWTDYALLNPNLPPSNLSVLQQENMLAGHPMDWSEIDRVQQQILNDTQPAVPMNYEWPLETEWTKVEQQPATIQYC